jgi:hypothetical protein
MGIIPGVLHSAGDRGSEGHNMGHIVTRFTERFGCRHPFACAGLAFAGMTPDLALRCAVVEGLARSGSASPRRKNSVP